MKKLLKRSMSLILCVCTLCVFMPAVYADDTPQFKISIEYEDGSSEGVFNKNDTVTAHVMAQRTDSSEGFDLYSLFLEVTFDTQYLTPTGYSSELSDKVTINSPLNIAGQLTKKQAKITYAELGASVPCANKVELARLTFKAENDTPAEGTRMGVFSGARIEGRQGDIYKLQESDIIRGIVHIGTPAESYSVTYDLNGAPGVAPTEQDHTKDSRFRLAAAPAREGYNFLGWNDGTQTLNAGSEYTMPANNVIFKAQWEKTAFTVKYDANGATSGTAPKAESIIKGTKVNVQTSDLKKDGYTFKGWSYNGKTYAIGETFTMPDADVTFTAVWEKNETSGGGGSGGAGGGSGAVSTVYPVNVTQPADGTVTTDKKTAAQGDTVTIAVTPADGYKVGTIAVKDKNGKTISTTLSNDKYTFKMPSSTVTVSVTFVKNDQAAAPAAGACPKDASCPIEPFTDTSNTAWWHDGIHYCLENGLMNGVSNNAFSPNGTTTRGMIVTILWRMEKSPATGAAMSFKDVPGGKWYTEAIRWAQSTGVVTGYNDEKFGPEDNITREQLAAILYRYASYKGINVTARNDLSKFADAGSISSWAAENVKWANASGLINGRSSAQIAPKANATRAEAASMIQRFCENVIEL